MKSLHCLALSLSVFAVVSGVAFAQDPFGDDPFGLNASTDKPIAQSPKSDYAKRTKDEIKATARELEKLKTMSLEKQVETLKRELNRSEDRRSFLASKLDDALDSLSESKSKSSDLENQLQSRIATLTEEVDETRRDYQSQHSTLNFLMQTFADVIAEKAQSETEADAIECLKLLSRLNSIDAGQQEMQLPQYRKTPLVARYESTVADMAKSETPTVRNLAVKLIHQAFPDLAISIGQQDSKEYWLPVEAIQGKGFQKTDARRALMERSEFEFFELPLEEVTSYCADLTGAVFTIAPEVDRETLIDFDAKGMLFGDALDLVLSQKKLSYNIKASTLIVVPEGKQETATLTYRVDRLVRNRSIQDLINLSKQMIDAKHHADHVEAVNDRCVMVVADETRQRKFAGFLAKLNAAGN